MRLRYLFFACVLSLPAQIQGPPQLLDSSAGVTDEKYLNPQANNPYSVNYKALLTDVHYAWEVWKNPDGSKTFKLWTLSCTYNVYLYGEDPPLMSLIPPVCVPLGEEDALLLTPVHEELMKFYSLAPGVPHYKVYKRVIPNFLSSETRALTSQVRSHLGSVSSLTEANARMLLYDGIASTMTMVDLTKLSVLQQVPAFQSYVACFATRPAATGPDNEVWAVRPAIGITIIDMSTGNVTSTIPWASFDPGNDVPVGIAFSNDGATAFYAVSFYNADSAGNNGALLVFDVASQTVTSKLFLKVAPTAFLMSPDSLSAYLLGSLGSITYYDVLSNSADLTLSTYTPGLAGGYGNDTVFIHPDGMRLFWNYGLTLEVFDLNTHKLTHSYSSGLSGTFSSMQMSPDGTMMWFTNTAGNIAIVSTQSGSILGTFTDNPLSALFPGPAY